MRTLLLMALVACSGGEEPQPQPHPPPPPPVEKPAPPPKAAPAEVWKLKEGHHPALLDPSQATEKAPDEFKARFETTRGDFVVLVHRDWAPQGADRFYNLVKIGFYEEAGFFRSIEGFMVQFGVSPYPEVSEKWREARIDDDPVKESNKPGRLTFATAGPNTRTTQLFINYKDNTNLDPMGFAPFGEVVEGMDVVNSLHKTGEGAPRGPGPHQGKLQERGNAYLLEKFPKVDLIKKVTILE